MWRAHRGTSGPSRPPQPEPRADQAPELVEELWGDRLRDRARRIAEQDEAMKKETEEAAVAAGRAMAA
ncbi:hypothetical protein GCM10029992_33220 [Glycomyces albus]